MKKLSLLLSLVSFLSLGQSNIQSFEDIIESDSSSIQTKINSIQSILNHEKTNLNDTIVVDYYLQLAGLYKDNQDVFSAIRFCDTILLNYKELDFYLTKEIEERKAIYQKRDRRY